MDVETTYKFDGDAQVSEVAAFLRDKHVGSGWATDQDDGKDRAKASRVGGYTSGKLRIEVVEEHESGD